MYHCAFCGRSEVQAVRLYEGPSAVFICNVCVADLARSERRRKLAITRKVKAAQMMQHEEQAQ